MKHKCLDQSKLHDMKKTVWPEKDSTIHLVSIKIDEIIINVFENKKCRMSHSVFNSRLILKNVEPIQVVAVHNNSSQVCELVMTFFFYQIIDISRKPKMKD